MRGMKIVALALIVAASQAAVLGEERPSSPTFRVIVNPSNPASGVDRKFLADAFLKRTTRWSNGDVIRPVDLDSDSPTRHRFSEDVLGRSVTAVKSYWQQVIFSGRDVPPPEVDSDGDVIKFVLKHTGGVGYVSGGADVGSVKVVTVR